MNLLSILGKVGGSILADVIPGGNAIISFVNEFLPTDSKLTTKATGAQIQNAASLLPEKQRTALLSKKFDVEIIEIKEHTKVIAALGEVDKTGNSTRPFIALLMAWVVSFAIVGLVVMLGVAINEKDTATVKAIGDNWPLVAALLGIPSGLLNSYFGKRTKEKQQKYQALTDTAPTSTLSGIVNLLRPK
jgi:hypothetical protein